VRTPGEFVDLFQSAQHLHCPTERRQTNPAEDGALTYLHTALELGRDPGPTKRAKTMKQRINQTLILPLAESKA